MSVISRDEMLHNEVYGATMADFMAAANPPDAPIIEVVSPNTSQPITPPVTVQLKFVAAAGATIDPTSFRVFYGWLGLDITDRITANVAVTAQGITAPNVSIDAGAYSLILQIADTAGRVGRYSLHFVVA